MFRLDSTLADTLCTIIAVGLIDANKNSRKKTTFIHENSGDSDRYSRETLTCLLDGIVEVEIKPQPMDKSGFPYIVGNSSRNPPQYADDVIEGLLHATQLMESRINRLPDKPLLKGAYIGGLSTIGKIEFLGPSDLYLYDPHFREISSAEEKGIRTQYNQAKTVSNYLIKFLNSAPYDGTGPEWRIPARQEEISENYAAGQLFGSVHGMTRSIAYYGDTNDKDALCVELALGADTCKVAACIPCSIFMWSKNTPAKATHFGRGDNWNFPKDKYMPRMRDAWEETVLDFYARGLNKIQAFSKVQQWNAKAAAENIDIGTIPQIFLEALTYESPFIDKITRTLS